MTEPRTTPVNPGVLFSERVRQYSAERPRYRLQLLEAGCGWGHPLDLGRIDVQTTGVDLDLPALRARTRARPDLDAWHLGDLRDVPMPPRAFDVVHAPYLIERLRNAELVLDRMAAALKPGGLFLVRMRDRDTAFGFLDRNVPDLLRRFAARAASSRVPRPRLAASRRVVREPEHVPGTLGPGPGGGARLDDATPPDGLPVQHAAPDGQAVNDPASSGAMAGGASLDGRFADGAPPDRRLDGRYMVGTGAGSVPSGRASARRMVSKNVEGDGVILLPPPAPTVYDRVASRAGMEWYCGMRGLVVAEQYLSRDCMTALGAGTGLVAAACRSVATASRGRLTAAHSEVTLVIRKPENRYARVI
ncbi:class I SAM-dependent methyltransferase [Actinomadura oligospora]|uniref:class I SAM-dependent methyltransferase n=1 Tax=Actinomadura oligospora TaxID=111804 RepID=UPI0004AECA2C|nr:class I SAM-dependent methyltransferase [Actinomadura oligospora]